MSTVRSTGRPLSSKQTLSALSGCSTPPCAHWRGSRGRRESEFPLPSHLHRRGVRRPAVRQRHLHRGDALCAVVALFGVEGRVRPSRSRLARDLRPAGRAFQLLEQLRALSLPRKADPADHPERARRQAAAGLRQGRECARLALCRGSCAGARARRHDWQGGRELQCRRAERAHQSERCRDDLRSS